jgi:hypothetical protein
LNSTEKFLDLFSPYIQEGSVVGIATDYGLDNPEFESRWGLEFPYSSGPAQRPRQPPVQWERVNFPGVKRPWCDINHPPPSCAESKERIELFLDFVSALHGMF